QAQEEIDRVICDSRLPDFSDRERFPCIEAVYLETLRWRPTIPLNDSCGASAFPHATSTSDVYNGYYISKGVDTIPDANQLCQILIPYLQVSIVKPERHLSTTGELLEGITSPYFDFKQMEVSRTVYQSIWASIISSLAMLQVGKGKNAAGCEVDVKAEFTVGLGLSV
ncbi:uncharacterized protein BJ212DRAFT_1264722, partial [Suillus subaureus]